MQTLSVNKALQRKKRQRLRLYCTIFKESQHTGDLTICLTAGPDSVWNNMCFLSFPLYGQTGGWLILMDMYGLCWKNLMASKLFRVNIQSRLS